MLLTTDFQKVIEQSTKVTQNVTGYIRLYLKYGNRNIENNTDIVYYEIRQYAYNPYGNYLAWEWSGSTPWSIKKSDETILASGNYTQTPAIYSDGKERVRASGSFTIQHNNDGTWLDTLTLVGTVYQTALTGTGEVSLPNIPRYATITKFSVAPLDETQMIINWGTDAECDKVQYTIDNGTNWYDMPSNGAVGGLSAGTTYNFKIKVRRKDSQLWTTSNSYGQTTYNYPYIKSVSNTNFTIGDKITIDVYNPLKRHCTAYINQNSTSGVLLGSVSGFTYGSGSYEIYTDANAMYSSIPNSQSGNCVFYIVSTSPLHTSGTISGTYKIKGNEKPTAGSLNYRDSNDTTFAITEDRQRIIRNNSNLLFTVGTATANNGASISKYKITFNGVSKERNTIGDLDFRTINLSNNSNAILEVIDSRGLIDTKEIEVTIDDWILPSAIIERNRKSNYYAETYIKVDSDYSNLNGKNEITIQLQYKKENETNYSELQTLEDNVQVTLELDNEYKWNVKVILKDKIGTTTYNFDIDRGIPIWFIDKFLNSIGVNCFPTKEKQFKVEGEIDVNGVIKTNNKEVAVLHNSQSGTSDGDSSGKWFKIAEFRASRWVTSCFTLQIMASGHGSSRGTIACSCYDYNFKYLTMLDGNIPVENIKLIQSSSDTADFTLYFKNLPEWYTTINATLLSSDTNNINVNVEPIGAELPNNGTIHNCTYDMNKVIEPAFASMTTTNSQNFTQEGQITVFGNSQENVSSGDFTCNTTYSRIDIPKGVECVEFGGNISGYNNASIALLINDQNGQNVKTNKLLVQAGGNGYWSHAIPTKVVKLDKTMSHYLYITCGPYNVTEFNLNAGFGSGGTSMWVRKLK